MDCGHSLQSSPNDGTCHFLALTFLASASSRLSTPIHPRTSNMAVLSTQSALSEADREGLALTSSTQGLRS